MSMIDALLGNRSTGVVQQLGQQFGLSDEQTSSALSALLPAVAAGVQQNASNPSGLEGLLGMLSGGGHQQYVEDVQRLGEPETIQTGNGILGQLFGSKDVSRQVAQRAADQTGVQTDVLKRMLPVVATIVMGALAQRHAGGMAGGAGLAPGMAPGAGQGGLFDMLGPILGGGGGGGSIVNDVIGMLGRFGGGR